MTEDERTLLLFTVKALMQMAANDMAGGIHKRPEDRGTAPSVDDAYRALRRVEPEYVIPSLERRIRQPA